MVGIFWEHDDRIKPFLGHCPGRVCERHNDLPPASHTSNILLLYFNSIIIFSWTHARTIIKYQYKKILLLLLLPILSFASIVVVVGHSITAEYTSYCNSIIYNYRLSSRFFGFYFYPHRLRVSYFAIFSSGNSPRKPYVYIPQWCTTCTSVDYSPTMIDYLQIIFVVVIAMVYVQAEKSKVIRKCNTCSTFVFKLYFG